MLFVGISLTVYAVAPAVGVGRVTVINVTSTTADIVVTHLGAAVLRFDIYTEDGSDYQTYTMYPGTTDPNVMGNSTCSVSGLLPNERYYVTVAVIGFPDVVDFEEPNAVTGTATFMTAAQ